MLPAGIRLSDNDSRILAVAMNLANDGLNVTVVSKDLPMRVKASSIGMNAEEYRAELAVDSGWMGHEEIDLSADDMAILYEDEVLRTSAVKDTPINTGLVIHSDRGSALAGCGPRGGSDRTDRPVGPGADPHAAHGFAAACAHRSDCRR